MRKIELTIVLLLFVASNAFSQGNDGATKMAASAIAGVIFYSILSLSRGLKMRKKNKD